MIDNPVLQHEISTQEDWSVFMRIDGKKITEPHYELLVLPRPSGDIAIKAGAVISMDEFDKLCPVPKAPMKIMKGGKKEEDLQSPLHRQRIQDHGKKRLGYMLIKSLESTENLEWEILNAADPNTWDKWEKELKDSGFSEMEIMRIIQTVMRANCLDEERLEEARSNFLLTQSELEQSSSLLDGQDSMPFGGPVRDSELDRPV